MFLVAWIVMADFQIMAFVYGMVRIDLLAHKDTIRRDKGWANF